jgi:rhodanese-related sulfurtransferase
MSVITQTRGISGKGNKWLDLMPQKPKKPIGKQATHKKKQHRKSNLRHNPRLWLILGISAVIIIVAVILLIPKNSGIPHISVADAYQQYQQGSFFLDVRSQEEWDQAHIAQSTLIPLDELQNRFSELPKDREIIVVCLSGHRSEEGVTILQRAGFTQAVCMTGGLTAWKEAGFPLVGSVP